MFLDEKKIGEVEVSTAGGNCLAHDAGRIVSDLDLTCVGQFIIDINCRSVLEKFAETGAGISKAPAWSLDLEMIQGIADRLNL